MTENTTSSTEEQEKKQEEESGEETEESLKKWIEELQAICDKKNVMFWVNQNNEMIVKDFQPPTYENADFKLPEWNIEKESFEYMVDEKKFPTAVKVKYKSGTVTAKSEHLYGIKGKGGITKINKPKFSKAEAEELARKTLFESLRDSKIEISFKCLFDPRMQIMDWIGVINPKTKAKEVFLLKSRSTDFDPKKIFRDSITCGFLPKSPDSNGSEGGDLSSIDGIGKRLAQFKYQRGGCSNASCFESTGAGDCHAAAEWVYNKLVAAGFKARIMQYATSSANNHRSAQYWYNGNWVNFDAKKYGANINFHYFKNVANGSIWRSSK